MPSTTQPVQRTVALSAIHVDEGFNPRDDAQRAEITGLADSIKTHGLIAPLVITPLDANGEYRLIDGERRYRACVEAGVVEVPVIVRGADEATAALDVALVANMARVDLSPLEQAKAFARLIDRGLTRKGVAERIGVSQKLVRERLVILDLPEDLHAQVGDGTIPPGAIRSLVELAKIHCGLPGRAVAEIAAADSGEYTGEPCSWADLARDPLQVATANAEQLPDDVYTTGSGYPLDRFTLTEKAGRDLARWANLDGRDPGELLVRFGAEDLAAAEKLGALHRAGNGWSAAIVGQDVADQLVADQVKELLKRAREFAKWSREDSPAEAGEAPEGGSVDEEAAKAERQREREAQQQARREAAAHNAVLGSACVKHLARVKVDDRVVRVLSAFDLGSELDKIALRGARYGLPGWPLEEQRKNGTTKTVYLDRADAEKKAREFLAGARSAAEIAGRQVVLLAMARYADEHAVAQSQRSFHTLTPGGQLPFSGEVIDQLDELCAEKVPAHVLDRGRDDRERQAAERAKDREDRAWLAEQYEGLEAMSPSSARRCSPTTSSALAPTPGNAGSSSSASASSTRSSRPPRSPPRATTKRASLPPNRLRNRRGGAIPGAPPVRPARVGHGMRP